MNTLCAPAPLFPFPSSLCTLKLLDKLKLEVVCKPPLSSPPPPPRTLSRPLTAFNLSLRGSQRASTTDRPTDRPTDSGELKGAPIVCRRRLRPLPLRPPPSLDPLHSLDSEKVHKEFPNEHGSCQSSPVQWQWASQSQTSANGHSH